MKNLIDAPEAFANAARTKAIARWPGRQEGSRLEPEAWPTLQPRFKLQKGETVFTIGSCFARNIERYLDRFGFKVPMLDFSVPEGELAESRPQAILNKYTPPAIFQELDRTHRLLDASPAERQKAFETLLLDVKDGVVDLELSSFLPVSRERALQRREEIFQIFRRVFDADVVTLTLGYIECWWDAERHAFCQNAPPITIYRKHKDRFFFKQMGYVEALEFIKKSIVLLGKVGRRNKRILLTTSPVPLNTTFTGQDVIIANTYSKSVLRAVCGRAYSEFPNVDYFPSYENVILTKQQYVWGEDLLHVTDQFVGNIVDRLMADYMTEAKVDDDDAAVRRASALLQMSKATEALDLLQKVNQGKEAQGAVGRRMEVLAAMASVANGDAAGLDVLRKEASTAGLTPDEALMAAKTLLAARCFDEAADVYQTCLENPAAGQAEQIECYLRLSRIRRRQRRLEEAAVYVEKAVAIAPKRATVVVEQIDLAAAMGRRERALELIKAAMTNSRIQKSKDLRQRLVELQQDLRSGAKRKPKVEASDA